MRFGWLAPARIIAGAILTASCALPQAYTISAKPGVVNHVEGSAYLNGSPLTSESLKMVALGSNDVISTAVGKAEVLLSPGVFLRLGENSAAKMISPSLTDTQIELKSGAAMIEVDDVVKGNRLSIIDHEGTVSIEKPGLYRLNAGDPPTVATIEGKAKLFLGEQRMDVSKGKEVVLAQAATARKFDTKKEDDLYAWSNSRSAFDAASSYQVSRGLNASGFAWNNGLYGGLYSPGWFWNSAFSNWAWLPGNGAFYSPFGYGFYGPGLVAYAPVMLAPVGSYWRGTNAGGTSAVGAPKRTVVAVPVNAQRPPAMATAGVMSPSANMAARNQAARAYSGVGFQSASGMRVPVGTSVSASGSNPGRGAASAASSGMSSAGAARPSGSFSSSSASGSHGSSHR